MTGANTGIGRTTAVGLARRGAHVLLACRSAERTRDALDEIAALPGPGAGHATFVALDLADLDAVRTTATEVRELLGADGTLDLLVNNAGVAGAKGRTAQGFELAFGVSHLGHFLLTTLLLDRIVAAPQARVVTLTSKAHFGAKGLDVEALRKPTRSPGGLVEYQVAKLCNVLFTIELARRLADDGRDTTACAVHPGLIGSDIWREIPWPIRPVLTLFMGSVGKGAERVLQGALGPPENGAYLDRGRPAPPSEVATPELAADLWKRSEDWVAPFCL